MTDPVCTDQRNYVVYERGGGISIDPCFYKSERFLEQIRGIREIRLIHQQMRNLCQKQKSS